ncbi:MAG: CHAT domain-containing tetratricopeptide repeat protein [Bacteroidota bacterium]
MLTLKPYSHLLLILVVVVFSGELDAQSSPQKGDKDTAECDALFKKAHDVFERNMDSTALIIQDVLPCYASHEDWENYVKCLNALSAVYYYMNDFNQFKKYSFEAVEKAQELLPADHAATGNAINNLNSYYFRLGNYDQSIKLLQQSLQIKESINEHKTELAIIYQNLGNAYRWQGDYDKALEYLDVALKYTLDSFPETYSAVPEIYDNMGLVYRAVGKPDLALKNYEECLRILKKINPPPKSRSFTLMIQSLQSISEWWINHGDTKRAKGYINQLWALQKQDDAYRKYRTYELLGKLKEKEGKLEEALSAMEAAERIADQFDGTNAPPFQANRHIAIGDLHATRGEPQKALARYQKALVVLSPGFTSANSQDNPATEQIMTRLDALEVLNKKAQVLWDVYGESNQFDDLLASFDAYILAGEIVRDIRQGVQTSESKITLSEQTMPVYEGAVRAALAAHQQSGRQEYLDQAFALAESNKAMLLLESINEQAAKGFADVPDSLLQHEKDLDLQLAFIQKQILNDKEGGQALESLKEQRFELKTELEELTAHLEKTYPRYFKAKYDNLPVRPEALREQMATSDRALLEYFVGEENIYLFVVQANAPIQVLSIEDRSKVMAAVERLRNLLKSSPTSESLQEDFVAFTESAHTLYQYLLADALDLLPAGQSELVIIPDHQLNFIPFEVLLTAQPDASAPGFSTYALDYLLEDYRISYDYSATLHARTPVQSKAARGNVIGFAPSFGTLAMSDSRACDLNQLYSLKCSEQEVTQIFDLMGGASRIADAANKATFEAEASKYRIIHLATHACIDDEDPMFSKIFLTDDYLSNYDLYNFDLNAELAVLSACNTGSGKLISGEGVMSLARGFITAGCASTVMSMWSVDDCATSDLMLRFYQHLENGASKNDALRQAKLDYLAAVDKTKMHPYYWAPFVQFGNTDAMYSGFVFDSLTNAWKWLAVALLLPLLFWGYRRLRA